MKRRKLQCTRSAEKALIGQDDSNETEEKVEPAMKRLHTALRFEQDDQSSRQVSAASLRTAEGSDVDHKTAVAQCSPSSNEHQRRITTRDIACAKNIDFLSGC